MGWSFLEGVTEILLWGIEGADQTTGPNLSWRKNLSDRWKLILERAPEKHNENDLQTLRTLKNRIVVLVRDRNIIVHGLVHGKIRIPDVASESPTMEHVPAWTVFRGPDAGKNFPISEGAVRIVYDNILKVSAEIQAFNKRHGYADHTQQGDEIEDNWPLPFK